VCDFLLFAKYLCRFVEFCNLVVLQLETIQLVDCGQSRGHSDDVMSAAYCPPNLLATSSYDGEVIVWNMVSGHAFCRLHSPVTSEFEDNPGQSSYVGYTVTLFVWVAQWLTGLRVGSRLALACIRQMI